MILVRSRETPLISIVAVVATASEALPPPPQAESKSALIRFSEESERVALPSESKATLPASFHQKATATRTDSLTPAR